MRFNGNRNDTKESKFVSENRAMERGAGRTSRKSARGDDKTGRNARDSSTRDSARRGKWLAVFRGRFWILSPIVNLDIVCVIFSCWWCLKSASLDIFRNWGFFGTKFCYRYRSTGKCGRGWSRLFSNFGNSGVLLFWETNCFAICLVLNHEFLSRDKDLKVFQSRSTKM